MPSISVIVPNYNHAPFLPRRIESILAQSRGDFELLILDDCSEDDSQAIIKRYAEDSRVRFAFNERNSGNSYLQWRKGIELTKGDYIWIAESDDFADSTLLERLGAKLDSDSEIGLAFCETVVVDAEERHVGWYAEQAYRSGFYGERHRELLSRDFVFAGRDYLRDFMFPWNTIPNASAVLFRRSALEMIGGPVTSMRRCGDWLTYCKILSRSKVGHVPDKLNYFREPQINVRRNFRGDTLAREWLEVARWGEQEVGPLPVTTRRQLLHFAANALLVVNCSPIDNCVPLRRMHWALLYAATLSPRLVPPTLMALLGQIATRLRRRLLPARDRLS